MLIEPLVDLEFKDPRRGRPQLDPHAERCCFALSPHERARERAARKGIEYGQYGSSADGWGNASTRIGIARDDFGWLSRELFVAESDPNPRIEDHVLPRGRRRPTLEELEEYVPNYWPKVI